LLLNEINYTFFGFSEKYQVNAIMRLSMPLDHLISEFIQALLQEIKAQKMRRGGSTVRLFNGRLLKRTEGLWVYHFQLESILAALDDTPAEIEIDGRKYNCQIISVKGLEVYLALEENFGPQIPEAVIQTNLWFLLEMLCKKFEEAKPLANKLFETSRALFAGISEKAAGNEELRYEPHPDPPNQSQERAIEASFSRSLAVIWGPPGTGKTKTIAKAVEAHLNAGRRVLLVSHANTAVDEALEKIAYQLKDTPFYQEGRLIRLGMPYKMTLEEKYPLVMLENVASMLGESLIKKRAALESELKAIEAFLALCKEISSKQEEIDSLLRRKKELGELLREEDARCRELDRSINSLVAERRQNEIKLAKAEEAGTLKRFFLALNPDRIRREIERQTATLESLKQEKNELELSCRQSKADIKAIEEEMSELTAELTALFHEHDWDPEQLEKQKKSRKRRLNKLNSLIADIDKALSEIQKEILNKATLVATTLTKTFSSKDFPDSPFDVLIVDESSMAPLPYLYWAAGKATSFITVVGDFLQLPPICISEEEPAKKWLGRSIFNVLHIDSVYAAKSDDRVSFLNTQYRMHPAIASISNELFYEGELKNAECTNELVLRDSLSGEHPLIFVNTEEANPWGSQLAYGGRFNLYHAFVAAALARQLLELYSGCEQVERIGIISPYNAQARLIAKIAEDMGIRDRIRVNTVHTFQGGEEPIIILDTVEGFGNKKWSMLDDKRPDGYEARLLANVALTRARHKMFLLGNRNYILETYSCDSVLCRIVDIFSEQGYVISSETIDDSFLVDNFEKWAAALAQPAAFVDDLDSSIYSEKDFWPVFTADLLSAWESVVIMSPFVAMQRTGRLQNCFKTLLDRGVKIRLFTRPPSEQVGGLKEKAEKAIGLLQEMGIQVIQLSKMHQKIAVIDRKITWEGSLNILSHHTSQEHMRRFAGPKTAEQLISYYNLDEDFPSGDDDLCPECAKRGITISLRIKQGKNGFFLACPNYPDCRYTRDLKKRRKRRG